MFVGEYRIYSRYVMPGLRRIWHEGPGTRYPEAFPTPIVKMIWRVTTYDCIEHDLLTTLIHVIANLDLLFAFKERKHPSTRVTHLPKILASFTPGFWGKVGCCEQRYDKPQQDDGGGFCGTFLIHLFAYRGRFDWMDAQPNIRKRHDL